MLSPNWCSSCLTFHPMHFNVLPPPFQDCWNTWSLPKFSPLISNQISLFQVKTLKSAEPMFIPSLSPCISFLHKVQSILPAVSAHTGEWVGSKWHHLVAAAKKSLRRSYKWLWLSRIYQVSSDWTLLQDFFQHIHAWSLGEKNPFTLEKLNQPSMFHPFQNVFLRIPCLLGSGRNLTSSNHQGQ